MSSEDPAEDLPTTPALQVRTCLSVMEAIHHEIRLLGSRVAVLEQKAYDTKPIWERALDEIMDTRLSTPRRRYVMRWEGT